MDTTVTMVFATVTTTLLSGYHGYQDSVDFFRKAVSRVGMFIPCRPICSNTCAVDGATLWCDGYDLCSEALALKAIGASTLRLQ